MVLENYDKLPQMWRAEIPLTSVLVVSDSFRGLEVRGFVRVSVTAGQDALVSMTC